MSAVVVAAGLEKSFAGTPALRGVDLEARPGELTLVAGPSGSGKTTLLNVLAGLTPADAGTATVTGVEVTALGRRRLTAHRARQGHVFQRSGLLRGLSVDDNLRAPHLLTGSPLDDAWVDRLLERLGIAHLREASAATLSGGQAQRVAMVRALAHRPPVLFADEPTASLDTAATVELHALLRDVAAEGCAVLLVSHDPVSADHADQVVTIVDGRRAD